MSLNEILFLVEDDPEGGFSARAIGCDVFVQGETMDEIRQNIKDAISCHFESVADRPQLIRMHYVHDEVLAS